MNEPLSDRKQGRPPADVEAWLDRWVSGLEKEEAAPAPSPEPPDTLEAPGAGEAPTRAQPALEAARAARAEVRVQGPVVTFPPGDAQVVLGWEGGQPFHRGSVAVRGPRAPSREAWLSAGLTPAQAQALEFVLAWHGAPFDAVAPDADGGGPRWGAWPLAGAALVRTLARWKARDADGFEARLGCLGVDASAGTEPERPSLKVLDVESGRPLHGREALALLGEDVRLVAALARAGREPAAQLAQLEWVRERMLRPDPAAAFTSPRALAVLLLVALRLGPKGAQRLVTLAKDGGQENGGERAALRLASELKSSGRARESLEVRHALASPELDEVRPPVG